jgi:hypothetical protein
MKLFRPVGLKEMELIVESNYKSFPPRLYWQPIFYPVLNQEYAEQIAKEWNTHDEFSGWCGIVSEFEVDDEYLKKYEVQNVGGTNHNELWIPSEELEEFNKNIMNEIRIVNVFFGKLYIPSKNKELEKKLQRFKTKQDERERNQK